MIEVYRVGSEVVIEKNIKALIQEVLISSKQQIQYKCVWWNGNTRISEWLYPNEIDGRYEDQERIGFFNGKCTI